MKKIYNWIFKKGVKLFAKTRLGESYPIVLVYNFLYHRLRSDFSVVHGHKMFLDQNDSLRLSIFKVYEPFQTELIMNEIKKGDIVLDIGANIGYYTLLFAKLVGNNGKVFAFEPDPKNFDLLKRNVELNNYKNVVLVQKAVSDKNGKIKLYLSKNNKAHHSVFNQLGSDQFIEIDAIKLDDYFKDSNNIDFIKIDVEGAEYDVFNGMQKTLNKNKNLKIITEFCPAWLEKCDRNPGEYLEELMEQGFKFYNINERKKKINLIGVSKLLDEYPPNRWRHTNLLCVKGEK